MDTPDTTPPKENAQAPAMSLRDQIRAATLGAKKEFKTEIVAVNGSEVEVRQPTLKERSDLRKRCTNVTEDSVEFNLFEFLIWAVIGFSYVPGTDEKVFHETDYDGLSAMPAGGWFDELSEAASRLTNVESKKSNSDSEKTPNVKVSM